MNPIMWLFNSLLSGNYSPAMNQSPLMTGFGQYNMGQGANPFANWSNPGLMSPFSNNLNGFGGSIFSPFTFNPFPFSPFMPWMGDPFGGFGGGMNDPQALPGRPMDGIPTGRPIATDIPVVTPGVQDNQPTFAPTLENNKRPQIQRNVPNGIGRNVGTGLGVRRGY